MNDAYQGPFTSRFFPPAFLVLKLRLSKIRVLGLVMLGVLALAANELTSPSIGAQEAPESVFAEIVDVRVVNLEVVVENRKGERVLDLTEGDFELLVDGQEIPLEFFSEVREGRTMAAAEGSEGSTGGAQPRLEPGERVETSYLVFIDDYFTQAKKRNRSLDGIRDYLSRLGSGDRMAVVAFDGRKIEMLSTWNQSPADLQEVFDRAKERKGFGYLTRSSLRESANGEYAAQDLETKVRTVASAVTATLRSFANPPGRKVMLLISGGWPYSPRRFVYESDNLENFDQSLRDSDWGRRVLGPITETANLLGYTVYPIDVPGITSTGSDISQARPTRRFNTAREDEIHSTLRLIADETGGRPLLDSARLDALDRVVTDTRTYYWLGFTPLWQGNDENHDIQIKMREKGLKVRHRESFQDLSRSKEVSFMVESAMLLGDLPGSRPMRVEFLKAEKKLRRLELPVRVYFPLDEVTVLPHQGRFVTQLELRVAAIDERGNRSDLDLFPVTLSGSRPPLPDEEGMQQLTLNLRKRSQELIFSLHDTLSGAILLERVQYQP
ncbi:MAG: VWA domain-containing protein [Deltaproteobacteria bacterium]|nr:VWA domain-containing protein [Deltaproteobacteria bacterium]